MKITKSILLLLSFLVITVCSFGQKSVKTGFWSAELALSKNIDLPFSLFYDESAKKLTVINGEEEITLDFQENKGDSVVYAFLPFNSILVFKSEGKKTISGYFYNKDRKTKGKIPFSARFKGRKFKVKKSKTTHNVTGRWKTLFSASKEDEYPAVGIFKQNDKGVITGTFLTETGDYRYLVGKMKENTLTLSCFDGSHAFLFEGEIVNDNLSGTFYSGSHWNTNWTAQRNEEFELSDPNELTYLKEGAEIAFSKPDTAGTIYTYPNQALKGKVVIIQLIGTWCPNCLDETNYFKELYARYHEEGLEIIALGYEAPKSFDEQAARIQSYSQKKNIPYPILVGGVASKDAAAQDFHMLNNITSFPTSIFINRQGEVVLIHTGFNGPGTGDIYQQYVQETNKLIERLLNE